LKHFIVIPIPSLLSPFGDEIRESRGEETKQSKEISKEEQATNEGLPSM